MAKPKRITYFIPLLVAVVLEFVFFQLRFWASLVSDVTPAPFTFIPLRFLLLVVVSYGCFAFRPSSRIYKMGFADAGRARAIILGVILIHAALFVCLSLHFADDPRFEPNFTKYEGAVIDDAQQYAYLANALLEGHVYLDLPVPDYLNEMENPYDTTERLALGRETGELTYWDYAFYDGHYYCYFGILPAIVLYLPFKIITGFDLPTYWAVGATAAIMCFAIAFFLTTFLKRYFPKTSLGVYLLFYMLFAMGSSSLVQLLYPLFYALPFLFSLILLFVGYGLLIRSKDKTKLHVPSLACGSLCLALVLACRPQMFLFIFMMLPLFWTEIVHKRLFFSRKGIANTCAVLVPCLVVGIACMVYNDMRFGSPFDFGSQYNLTYIDLTQRTSPSLKLALYALVFYILLPLELKRSFPYVESYEWNPIRPTTVEPFYGGFFAFNPACIALLLLPAQRAFLKKRGLWGFCLTGIVIAVLFMVLDVWLSSISMRYMSDFCFGLLVPSLCVWCSLFARAKTPRQRKILRIILAVAVIFGEFIGFYSLLGIDRYGAFIESNPWFYSVMEQWFTFW